MPPNIPPLRWKDNMTTILEELKACPCTRLVLLHAERASVLKPLETETVTAHTCKCVIPLLKVHDMTVSPDRLGASRILEHNQTLIVFHYEHGISTHMYVS